MMDVTELDSLRIVLDPIGQTGVALALMLVMFSVALGLRVDDFRFLLGQTRVVSGRRCCAGTCIAARHVCVNPRPGAPRIGRARHDRGCLLPGGRGFQPDDVFVPR